MAARRFDRYAGTELWLGHIGSATREGKRQEPTL